MTHDELLGKIGEYTICKTPTRPGMACDNNHLKEIYPEWFALRAAVELHKPNGAYQCNECGGRYPCPTIQAIIKELE